MHVRENWAAYTHKWMWICYNGMNNVEGHSFFVDTDAPGMCTICGGKLHNELNVWL